MTGEDAMILRHICWQEDRGDPAVERAGGGAVRGPGCGSRAPSAAPQSGPHSRSAARHHRTREITSTGKQDIASTDCRQENMI